MMRDSDFLYVAGITRDDWPPPAASPSGRVFVEVSGNRAVMSREDFLWLKRHVSEMELQRDAIMARAWTWFVIAASLATAGAVYGVGAWMRWWR